MKHLAMLLFIATAMLAVGCTQEIATQPVERIWSSVDTSGIGETRALVSQNLGAATCSDSLSDTNFPGEEIVTFSKDGCDYRNAPTYSALTSLGIYFFRSSSLPYL